MKNFTPSRLTAARECRGLTMKSLADQIGVTSRTIMNYESGQRQPASVEDVANAVHFPVDFFYGDDLDKIPERAITFRASRSLTAGIRDMTIGRSKLASRLVSTAIRKQFRLPDLDLPTFPELRGDPETAARLVRNHWGLGQSPAPNMVHLLEAKGIEIYWLNVESPCVDAVCYRRENRPFIFLNSHKGCGERDRYNLAHELGHLVLHEDVENADSHEIETEANRFAGAFMLPREQFWIETPRMPMIDNYLPLKRKWKVSVQSMIVRSFQLGRFSKWQYERAFIEMNRKNIRAKEIGFKIPVEQSHTHYQVYGRLSERGIRPAVLAYSIGLSMDMLCELTPVAAEFTGPTIKHLRMVTQ